MKTQAEILIKNWIGNGGNYQLSLSELKLKKLPEILKGMTIKNHFFCSHNELTTLENSPKIIQGSFWCFDNKLVTLEGGPEIVKWQYNCAINSLKNLKGCPTKVGELDCSSNENLTSLEGCPTIIEGDLICEDCPSLKTLKGTPYVELKGKFIHDTISDKDFKDYMKYKRLKEELPELEGIF